MQQHVHHFAPLFVIDPSTRSMCSTGTVCEQGAKSRRARSFSTRPYAGTRRFPLAGVASNRSASSKCAAVASASVTTTRVMLLGRRGQEDAAQCSSAATKPLAMVWPLHAPRLHAQSNGALSLTRLDGEISLIHCPSSGASRSSASGDVHQIPLRPSHQRQLLVPPPILCTPLFRPSIACSPASSLLAP